MLVKVSSRNRWVEHRVEKFFNIIIKLSTFFAIVWVVLIFLLVRPTSHLISLINCISSCISDTIIHLRIEIANN